MDPNQVLGILRRLIDLIRDPHRVADEDDIILSAETFQQLDEWLSKGGFFPTEWNERDANVKGKAPDRLLNRARDLARMILSADEEADPSDVMLFADTVYTCDDWMTTGGKAFTDWKAKRKRRAMDVIQLKSEGAKNGKT